MQSDRLLKIVMAVVAVVGFVMLMVFSVNSGKDASLGNLDRGTWNLETLVLDDTETAVIAGTNPTIEFSDEQVAGTGGCNSYQGGYQTDGSALNVGPVAATERFCQDPAGVSDQEVFFLAHLTSADEFQIDDDQLILSADGARLMVLTR